MCDTVNTTTVEVLFWIFVYDVDILLDLDIPMSNKAGKESQYMVSRPELGSDPPFGSGRESGRDKLVSEPRFRRFWKESKISDAPT